MPRSSLQQLTELNQKRQNTNDELQYDDNLFRDEVAQVQSQEDEDLVYSVKTRRYAGTTEPKDQERQMGWQEARAMKKRVTFQDDIYGEVAEPNGHDRVVPGVRQSLQPMWFDFTDRSEEIE